ncbi:MAG: 1-acylglycerol-3-phosphate O-acyltransferase [Spirochaetales bacterium]|nr:1-acylglycerol-3-phosphate O-acyltransferase [Leptospiraceae bacterium]MCP5481610.1 1-acylglycerol-3-phosphate O-acyltransferase [Spirochaetales bacterium]MCP5484438.1 1-acylglycerol-3-phosphate O-acyltransferase [Spirochaetales bacterium]
MSLLWTLWVWFFALGFTGLICVFAIPFALFHQRSVVHRLGRYWGAVLSAACGIRIVVENPERFYRDGTMLLVANHQSLLDVVAFFTFIDVPFGAMAKASLFKIPLFGAVIRGVGCIPVVRGNARKSMHSLVEAVESVRAGHSLMIFPEGHRSPDEGSLLPFKKGAFILAKKAAVPLQPITIFGANRLMHPRQKKWLPRIQPGTIRIVVHRPLMPEEYADLDAERLADRVFLAIDRPLERLKQIADILDA